MEEKGGNRERECETCLKPGRNKLLTLLASALTFIDAELCSLYIYIYLLLLLLDDNQHDNDIDRHQHDDDEHDDSEPAAK